MQTMIIDDWHSGVFQSWLQTRPKEVQELANQFRAGEAFKLGNEVYYVIGWTEGGMICITPVDPTVDHAKAAELRQHVHADCLGECEKVRAVQFGTGIHARGSSKVRSD